MSVNLDRVNVLLDVVHKAASAGPGLNNLSAKAMAELNAMDDEAGNEIAKARVEADKKAANEAAAKAKADADKAKAEEAKLSEIVAAKPTSVLESAGAVERKI